MDGIKIEVTGNVARCTAKPSKITAGTVGLPVEFTFDAEHWAGLSKTAVFLAGHECKIAYGLDSEAIVPWELLEKPGVWLNIGVYGTNEDGTVVIPTTFANISVISPGANPGGDPSTDPTPPVWQEVIADIGDTDKLETDQKNNLVDAVNEVYNLAKAGGVKTDETLSIKGSPADAAAVGEAFANHPGLKTDKGGEIFNFYTDPVYTGDNPPKEYPGNTANKGSHAQNFGTHADGEYSSASGWNSTASGGIANATGRETLASGYASTTEGYLATASGRCAHAGGTDSDATGENAFAFGEGATSSGKNAFACGKSSKASNSQAFAIGNATEASGSSSFAGGSGTKATASQAVATGNGAEATGANSFAHGIRAKSTSNTSFAIGEDTEAGGFYAIASGYKTKALGTCTMAGGRDTEVKAEAYAATAIGRGTIANSRYQFVRGQYNKPDEPDPNKSYIGEYAEIVGNGTASDPKNIYTLDWDGNGWFAGGVYVGEYNGRNKKLATVDQIPTTAAAVGAVPTSRTINGNPLTKNVVLDANVVGAAPAGFGLGGASISISDANAVAANGWYYIGAGTVNKPEHITYGTLFHKVRTTNNMMQEVIDIYGSMAVRTLNDGKWQEWEYVNPPMMPDVEYRTTERSGGLPVYTKTFGVQANVTTTFGTGEYDHGITGFKYLCRVEARTESNVLPLITNDRTVCISGVTKDKVKISATKQDFTDYTSVTLWYTKD